MNLIERWLTFMSDQRDKKETLKLQRKFNHTFKLNEIENDKLKHLQSVTGMSVSKIVRDTLFNEQSILSSGRIENVEELNEYRQTQIDLMKMIEQERIELNRIGNNINQIAKQLNARSEDSFEKELKESLELLKSITLTNREVVEQLWQRHKSIELLI